jgi:hypothetical protein
LDLGRCDMEEVPLSLLSLTGLQHLSLASNDISKLDIVQYMPRLTSLNIGRCSVQPMGLRNPCLPTCQVINLASTGFSAWSLERDGATFFPALRAVQLLSWQCTVHTPFEMLPTIEEIYIEVEDEEEADDDDTCLPMAAFFTSCAGIPALRKVAMMHPGGSGLENFKEFMDGVVDLVRARPDVEFDFSNGMGDSSNMLFD